MWGGGGRRLVTVNMLQHYCLEEDMLFSYWVERNSHDLRNQEKWSGPVIYSLFLSGNAEVNENQLSSLRIEYIHDTPSKFLSVSR